jgi:hypothetical protein
MLNPFWVAAPTAVLQRTLSVEIRPAALRIKEGRTRPSPAMTHHARHFYFWTRPETAKPASSQGEALAKNGNEETLLKTSLKDMIMEFTHD